MTEPSPELTELFPDAAFSEFRGQQRFVIDAKNLRTSMRRLRDAGFDLLVDVTCVDYLQYRAAPGCQPPGRFGLVYLLANTVTAQRLTVRVFLDDVDRPELESVVSIWEGANWMEREVYDMFGIVFGGHPDLRRILLPDEFSAYPLRKDYPLQGRGERHNFAVIARGQA